MQDGTTTQACNVSTGCLVGLSMIDAVGSMERSFGREGAGWEARATAGECRREYMVKRVRIPFPVDLEGVDREALVQSCRQHIGLYSNGL